MSDLFDWPDEGCMSAIQQVLTILLEFSVMEMSVEDGDFSGDLPKGSVVDWRHLQGVVDYRELSRDQHGIVSFRITAFINGWRASGVWRFDPVEEFPHQRWEVARDYWVNGDHEPFVSADGRVHFESADLDRHAMKRDLMTLKLSGELD